MLAKPITCAWKSKFNSKKFNSNQNLNINKYRCEWENPKENNAYQKNYIWNPITYKLANNEYLTSTIHVSAIMCGKIIDSANSVSTNWLANVMRTVSTHFYKKIRYSGWSWVCTKMHIQEINIKNGVSNCYFGNLVKD